MYNLNLSDPDEHSFSKDTEEYLGYIKWSRDKTKMKPRTSFPSFFPDKLRLFVAEIF